MHQKLAMSLCAAWLAIGASGCLLAGNYHSAKTLGKGESSFGMTMSMTSYEFENPVTGETTRVAFPGLVPEFTYHVGLSDDLEVGGRFGLSQLAMEADLKYRFYKSDTLHLALAPAIGAQYLIVTQGTILRLPAIATYQLADNFAVNGALFAQSTRFSSVTGDDSDLAIFSGSLLASGGAVSLEFSGEVFAIRPGIEFARYLADYQGNEFRPFNTVSIFVHLAFIGGREKKQLNRIENKIDQMTSPAY